MNCQHHSTDVAARGGRLARRARATGSGPTSAACRCWRSPPTASRSRSRGRTARKPALAVLHAGWRGLLGGIASTGVAGARRRARRRGRRPGDRPVLLRGRGGGRRAVSRALRARPRPRRQARPLERGRAGAARGRLRARRARRPLHAPAIPSSSSRTAATAASRAGRESLALSPETVRAQPRAHPRRARPRA